MGMTSSHAYREPMTADVTIERGKEEADELAIYKKLYRQAQELIIELQEQLALAKSLIGRHEELGKIQERRIQELEAELAEVNDRLKTEQERSAQFKTALKKYQDSAETKPEPVAEPAPVTQIDTWAVKEVAAVPLIASAPPEPKPSKRGIDSLAAVKLPQFPPLRRR